MARRGFALASALLALTSVALGHSEGPQERVSQSFRTGTSGVVVDVVVRDKKGRPVTGLTAADFEVFEDGVRQTILTLSEPAILPSDAPSGASPADARRQAAGTATSPEGASLSFTALVFERLTPEGRALAHTAALKQLEGRRAPNEYVGVFVSDLSLITLQPYTSDEEKLRAAVDAAAMRATSRFRTEQEKNPSPTASAESGAQPMRAGLPSRGPDAIIAQMIRNQEVYWDRLERSQQGHASMNALMALCASLGALPGRKTVVFFAEDLAVPPGLEHRFQRLVDVANLENVSIYTVDAAGLRVHSDQAAVGRRTSAAGVGSLEASASSPFGGGGTSDVYDMISRDPHFNLTLLAKQTGGFLIANTNDLAKGLRAIDDDRRHYYLLTYSPTNAEFNGERRRIEVKVTKKDATVRARSGYVAAK